jgi:hypothetical protein
MIFEPSSVPGTRIVASISPRVTMFSGRFTAAEKRGDEEKIAQVANEFIRFAANIAERHGSEYAALAVQLFLTSARSAKRLNYLMQAASRARQTERDTKEKRLIAALKEALLPHKRTAED